MKKLSREHLKKVNGGVQGYCNGYCVPKPMYTVSCVNNWCVYKIEPIEP